MTKILTPEKTLDVAAYKEYSPLFLGTFFSLTYGVSFGALSSVIVHTIIFHGPEIVERWRLARNQDADVHLKMMRKYRDTPNWWYYALFAVLFALSLVTVLVWDTHLTWWALIVAFLLSIVFLVPIGMIQGITNTQLGLNVLTEFMVGYMLPGRPIAMMLFKTFGYITMAQALYFIQDMKFGHYLKVPVSHSRLISLNSTTRAIANQTGLFFDSRVSHLRRKSLLVSGPASSKLPSSTGLWALSQASVNRTSPTATLALVLVFSTLHPLSGVLSAQRACLAPVAFTRLSSGIGYSAQHFLSLPGSSRDASRGATFGTCTGRSSLAVPAGSPRLQCTSTYAGGRLASFSMAFSSAVSRAGGHITTTSRQRASTQACTFARCSSSLPLSYPRRSALRNGS